ncbi:MAG: hypothetical protein K9M07_02745 [Simkaniaceae bacterium]|nr:hypothetical protein [Simkaniaceae bacterium]MCF7852140.1 hypothetical protein [Simkaniaceae bacterium]
MFYRFLIIILSFMALCHSDSLQLYNDSFFTLDAVVIDANGNVLGMTTVEANNQLYWYYNTENVFLYANRPYVPFTVIWYCHEGATEYGIWTNATSGSLVTAQNSVGKKTCKLKDPKKLLKEAEKQQSINNFTYD